MARKKAGLLREVFFDKPAAEKEYKDFKKSDLAKTISESTGISLEDYVEKEDFMDALDNLSKAADIKSKLQNVVKGTADTSASQTKTNLIEKSLEAQQQGTSIPEVGESFITTTGGLGKTMSQTEIDEQARIEKIKAEGVTRAAQEKDMQVARKTGTAVQLATKMFADGMTDVVRESKDTLKEEFGVTLDPTRGLEGKAFAFLQKAMGATGYNSYFDSVAKGMSNELAAEFAKAGGASRLGYFILNAFKDTIPKLGEETLESGGFQLIKSATNGYRKWLKEAHSDKDFDVLSDMLKDFEEKTTKDLMGGFTDAGIYSPKIYEFKTSEMDKALRMPSYMIPFYAKKMGIKLKDIDAAKELVRKGAR